MFQTVYSSSPLVSAAADEIFPRIKGDAFRGDVSFISLMRALLYERLPADAEAGLFYKEATFRDVNDNDPATPQMIAGLLATSEKEFAKENRVWVVSVSCENEEQIGAAQEKFASVKDFFGLHEEQAVEQGVLAKAMKAKCYIDFEHARTLIMVFDRMTVGKWHILSFLTPRYFKRYFDLGDANKPLTEWERTVLIDGIIAEKTPDKFTDAILKFSEQFDFRSPAIRAALKGFESRDWSGKVNDINRQMEQTREQIENINRQYASYVRKMRTLDDTKAGLMLNEQEERNDLMEYFLANKNLTLVSSDENSVTFYAKTYFANFDDELAKRLITHPDRGNRVDIYCSDPSGVKKEDRDLLFKALFVDKTIRVWLYGKFVLRSNGGDQPIYAVDSAEPIPEVHDCCPNPHLYHHACMGDNKRAAIDSILNGDYVTAVEQTIGSVASVNLNESATAPRWMRHLLSDSYGRFFETADGTRMKFSEVMKYLKEEEKKAKQEGAKKNA